MVEASAWDALIHQCFARHIGHDRTPQNWDGTSKSGHTYADAENAE